IERQYGKVRRVWLMDRGVPTEEGLAEMRVARPAGALSGGHAKGSLDAFGKTSDRQVVARGATRRPEPAPAKASPGSYRRAIPELSLVAGGRFGSPAQSSA